MRIINILKGPRVELPPGLMLMDRKVNFPSHSGESSSSCVLPDTTFAVESLGVVKTPFFHSCPRSGNSIIRLIKKIYIITQYLSIVDNESKRAPWLLIRVPCWQAAPQWRLGGNKTIVAGCLVPILFFRGTWPREMASSPWASALQWASVDFHPSPTHPMLGLVFPGTPKHLRPQFFAYGIKHAGNTGKVLLCWLFWEAPASRRGGRAEDQ